MEMAESFEFEFQKKLTKIREELSKREVDVRGKLADIEKIKLEALKKTEDMKYSAHHDLEKVDQDVMKMKDLNAQLKARLASEIAMLKNEIEKKYADLRSASLGKTTST
jgi:regulatory protein YycI of two-component signal transduction system YycFG